MPKNDPRGVTPRLETEGLGSQKKPKPLTKERYKIRKMPYKWAIKVSKMNPKILTRRGSIRRFKSRRQFSENP